MRIRRPFCVVCLVFVLLVMCRVYIGKQPQEPLPSDGEKIILTGRVENKEYRTQYDGEALVLYLSHVKTEAPKTGKIAKKDTSVMCYLTVSDNQTDMPRIGEKIRASGKVSLFREATNPGEFDLREYYQISDISYQVRQTEILGRSGPAFSLKEKLFEFRCRCGEALDKIYPAKEASVLKAMILGEKSSLNEEIKELYQLNGLIHILSISGLHVSLLGMALYGFLKKCFVPIWLRAPAAIAFLWCYGMMTGMGVSTWRAVFMFSLRLAAELLGRTYDMLTALSFAAILMLWQQPLLVKHSGFLLSFGAVLGIAAVLPWWEDTLKDLAALSRRQGTLKGEAALSRQGALKGEAALSRRRNMGKGKEERRKSGEEKTIRGKILEKAGAGFLLSTAIAITTLPILLYFYYVYPIYSLLLNLYVIPLMGLVLAGGIVSMTAGMLWPEIGSYLALPDRGILWLYEASCKQALKLPGGIRIGGQPAQWQMILYYGTLFLLVAWWNLAQEQTKARAPFFRRGQNRRVSGHPAIGAGGFSAKLTSFGKAPCQGASGHPAIGAGGFSAKPTSFGKAPCQGASAHPALKAESFHNRKIISLPPLCAWLLITGMVQLLLFRPVGGFTTYFLDVGQGDCIVMVNENGKSYMVDGGSTSKSETGKYQILPFLESRGIGELEAVFLTHPDEDHISGVLELMEQSGYGVKIEALILPDAAQEMKDEELLALRRAAAKNDIPVYYVGRGDVLQDRKLRFTCLGPEKGILTEEVNEISTVLYVEYGQYRMLLTGDVTGEPEQELLNELERREDVTVLKVAHHGSRYSTPEELLELTSPAYAVISAGENNRYGHPHEELLTRLCHAGSRILQTPESGAIWFWTDGKHIRVREFRGETTDGGG